MPYEPDYDLFDEYGDQDAINCTRGDYNVWEENQIALDNDYDDWYGDDLRLDE